MAARKKPNEEARPAKQITDPGGEVVSVEVRVNGILHFKREGVLNVLQGATKRFKTDDGEMVQHNRALGVIGFARALLKPRGGRDV